MNGRRRVVATTAGRRTGLHALVLAALFTIATGCSTTAIPDDVRGQISSAVQAEEADRHEEAIVFYTGVLNKHEELAEILLARGECYMVLAEKSLGNQRTRYLESALADFQAAGGIDSEPRLRLVTRMEEAVCLVELARSEQAKAVLQWILQSEVAEPEELAEGHCFLGSLLLRELHERVAVDGVIAANDSVDLELCRRARHHFGEALMLTGESSWPLYGKAICLFHEQLFGEAEEAFERAREVGSLDNPMVVYLTALARERRIRINEESNRAYLRALELDAAQRSFSPVYVKLYDLLMNTTPAFGPRETERALLQLLEYRGDHAPVWQAAHRFYSTPVSQEENASTRLGRAVTLSRLGDAEGASKAFVAWCASQPTPADAGRSLELVFGQKPLSDDPVVQARAALERARAYRLVFPTDVAARAPAREVLDELITLLHGLPESRTRDDLLGETVSLLADELLEVVAKGQELGVENPDALLKRAEELTLQERRLREGHLPAFRLGRIQQLLKKDPHYPLDIAIQAARLDKLRSDEAVYQTLASWFGRLRAAQDPSAPKSDQGAKLAEDLKLVEEELLRYQGSSPAIVSVVDSIKAERERARIEQEAHQRELAKAVQERLERQAREEAEAKMRPPCGDCGGRALKTDAVCPVCGNVLPEITPQKPTSAPATHDRGDPGVPQPNPDRTDPAPGKTSGSAPGA
ncbi:MAG: hypothetical protein AB7O52_17830 [Planctomycetota bacterium]